MYYRTILIKTLLELCQLTTITLFGCDLTGFWRGQNTRRNELLLASCQTKTENMIAINAFLLI